MDRVKNIKILIINKLQKFLKFVLNRKQNFKKNQKKEKIFKNNIYSVNDYNKIERSIIYITQPYIFYIKNNIDFLLDEIINEFILHNFILKIGIEIEFYSLREIKNCENFYKTIFVFAEQNNIDIYNVEKERGINQFEIQFKPYINIYKLIDDFNKVKNFLQNSEYEITFKSVPFYYDVGSALQVNITLNTDKKNLFARIEKNGKKYESNLIKNCIAGLLEKTNIFLPLYIKSKNCLYRYDKDFCEIFYNQGKIPSPVFNSWGINNRTCSIRIPVPKNFNDFNNYQKNDDLNRRIEFRVPSSDSNIKLVIYGVLKSMMFGITYNLQPIEQTTNNVLKNNNDYKKIKIENQIISNII